MDERHAMFDECCEHNDHLRLCSGWIVGYPEVTCRGLPDITSVDVAITLQCVLLRPAPVTTRSQGDFWGAELEPFLEGWFASEAASRRALGVVPGGGVEPPRC